MPRLIIQSKATGRFLAPALEDGQPTWFTDLRQAGGGVVADLDAAIQLMEDLDFDDMPQVVDLDILGTKNDYAN